MQTLSQQSPAHRTLSTLLCPKIYLHLLTNLDNIHCAQERANRERERERDRQTNRERKLRYIWHIQGGSPLSYQLVCKPIYITLIDISTHIYPLYIYIYNINEGLKFHQTVPHCERTFGRHRFDVHSILLHFLAWAETRSSKVENPIYIHFIRICYARSMIINQLYQML